MNSINLTGTIISMKTSKTQDNKMVANVLLYDSDNPKRPVFKASLWEKDAEIISNEELNAGDVLSIDGKIYCLAANEYGTYIDIRQCRLISICKVERKQLVISESSCSKIDSYKSCPDKAGDQNE